MCLCLSKALPRRRVSVAVVPKFNLLNIPGQTPVPSGPNIAPGALPVLVSPISSTLPRQQTRVINDTLSLSSLHVAYYQGEHLRPKPFIKMRLLTWLYSTFVLSVRQTPLRTAVRQTLHNKMCLTDRKSLPFSTLLSHSPHDHTFINLSFLKTMHQFEPYQNIRVRKMLHDYMLDRKPI